MIDEMQKIINLVKNYNLGNHRNQKNPGSDNFQRLPSNVSQRAMSRAGDVASFDDIAGVKPCDCKAGYTLPYLDTAPYRAT